MRSDLGADFRRARVHALHFRQRDQKLMLTILYVMVGGTTMLVLVVLAVVVVGIKQEPSAKELPSQAPNALTAWVRRLLGVYVRKPDQPSTKIAANPGSPPRNPPRWSTRHVE